MKKLINAVTIVFLSSLSGYAQNVPSYVPTNGLVGWWPFNSNANDESGNGNNGTVNGATLSTDRFGNSEKAYSFNNNDIFIQNSFFNNGWENYSLSIWFLSNDLKKSTQTIYNTSPDHVGEGLIINHYSKPNLLTHWKNSDFNNGSWDIFSGNPFKYDGFKDSQWYHIVVVKNGGTYSYYINGLFDKNTTVTKSAMQQMNGMRLGFTGYAFIVDHHLNGKLDDFGVWNRALTDQEITKLYKGDICYQHITVTDTLIINTKISSYNPIRYENTIKIFPNPTKDHITIDFGDYSTVIGYQIKISNSLGQQMFQSPINQKTSYIDLKSWTGNGIYFVSIIDETGNIIDIRKIVIQ
ncbi:MAG: LamG-like jellyroll fold domain-containing protein [Bacteroidales bacterium]